MYKHLAQRQKSFEQNQETRPTHTKKSCTSNILTSRKSRALSGPLKEVCNRVLLRRVKTRAPPLKHLHMQALEYKTEKKKKKA